MMFTVDFRYCIMCSGSQWQSDTTNSQSGELSFEYCYVISLLDRDILPERGVFTVPTGIEQFHDNICYFNTSVNT